MGLKNIIKKAVRTAFKVIGDIPVEATYTVYGDTIYDEETGEVIKQRIEFTNIGMVFGSYSSNDLSDVVIQTDIKALVPVDCLPGIKPAPNNEVLVTSSSNLTIRSGSVYSVVGDFKIDEAEAMYEIQLRGIG